MKLQAATRLNATPWSILAMPQVVPEEHVSRWFDDFDMLSPSRLLFEYGGHEVWGYTYEHDPSAKFFVALDSSRRPVYINEVQHVEVGLTGQAKVLVPVLQHLKFWMQSSVSFSEDADRARLRGLATKIFWDYLASNGNAAITDSQQTPSGATFWKKILTGAARYLVVRCEQDYRVDKITLEYSNSPNWDIASHVQYGIHTCWRDSDDGKLVRIIVTRR